MDKTGTLLAHFLQDGLEAGCDEAGRGCLAGPVFAAAVILPRGFSHPMLRDSKQLNPGQRQELRGIIEAESIAWAVGSMCPEEIDTYNILHASFLAMHRAIQSLRPAPQRLLIDGNRFLPFGDIPFHCFVKGDDRFASIAAASILAKTHRDAWMDQLHEAHPQYGWSTNKGYPTAEHRQALLQHGPTIHHRKTFRLLPDPVQGKLF